MVYYFCSVCEFDVKVASAKEGGASAVLVVNSEAGSCTIMDSKQSKNGLDIPVCMVQLEFWTTFIAQVSKERELQRACWA